MFIIILTKATGFLYSAVVATKLGAGRETDLFFLANTIPEMLGNLILLGLVSAVFIPIFVKVKENEGKDRFHDLLYTLLNMALVTYLIIAILLVLFAHQLFPLLLNSLVHSDFTFSPEELSKAANMMIMLIIPQILLGISVYYTSALNVYNRFVVPQLAPLFYNLGRIIGAFLLVPYFGVEGLVYGAIIGAFFHLLIQLPIAKNLDIKFKFILDYKNKYVREAINIGTPRILGIGGEQIANGVDKFIAARFIQGSVTAFNFGLQLIQIPLSLFGMTYSIASFPRLSRFYHQGKKKEFEKLLTGMINQILFLAIPVTIILLVLRVSLVRLFFGLFGGKFDFEDTYLTAWVVLFFGFGLSVESVRSLLYRAFYAAGDTWRPLIASVFTVFTGILSGLIFTNYFSHFDVFDFSHIYWEKEYFFQLANGRAAVGGLALSSSLVFTIEFFILLFLLNKYIVKIDFKKFAKDFLKKVLAGLVMALGLYSIFKFWGGTIYQQKTIILLFLTTGTSIFGGIFYLIICKIWEVEELEIYIDVFNKKVIQPFKKYWKVNGRKKI